MKKALILSCSITGQGHNSCARAVKEYFDRKQVDCTVVDACFVSSQRNLPYLWGKDTALCTGISLGCSAGGMGTAKSIRRCFRKKR